MGPRAARGIHLGLTLLGAVLYFLFIIPRWWVLTGDFPATLGTVGRIAAGVPIAAAAIPVMLTLQRSLKPEAGTPEPALRLRAWSAVLHVVAGILMIATAVAEIWLGLQSAGPWLFAVYGAAGAIAVLAVLAFVLSFVAEKPPAPARAAKIKAPRIKKAKSAKAEKTPKSEKAPKTEKTRARAEKAGARPSRIKSRRGRKKDATVAADQEATVAAEDIDAETASTETADAAQDAASDADGQTAQVTAPEGDLTPASDAAEPSDSPEAAEPEPAEPDERRPTGKSRHRLRR